MSVRGLAAAAVLLGLLCIASGALLVHRLGWCEEHEPVEWEFVNAMLSVPHGQRVVVRPMLEGEPTLRYTFLAEVTEPRTDDPMAPVPHLRAGVEEGNGADWEYLAPESFTLCLLGAMAPQEWLVEIGPVVERGGPGGPRTLLKAAYGHRNGAAVAYYHDPARRVPGFGWIRRELVPMGGGMPEVQFASDGGIVETPLRDR